MRYAEVSFRHQAQPQALTVKGFVKGGLGVFTTAQLFRNLVPDWPSNDAKYCNQKEKVFWSDCKQANIQSTEQKETQTNKERTKHTINKQT